MGKQRLIDLKEVQRRVSLGRTSIWAKEKQGLFPQGRYLPGLKSKRYVESEIDAYVDGVAAAPSTSKRSDGVGGRK